MARPKRRRRLALETKRPDMTAMIDVTFLLLVFFMMTIQFKSLDMKLSAFLPKDVGVNPTPHEPKDQLVVRIDVAPASAAGVEPITRYRVGPFSTTQLAHLRARVAQLRRVDPELEAAVDAREGVTHGQVIDVIDELGLAGFREVSFVAPRR